MQREEWFERKWHHLRRFGYFALGGLLLIAIGLAADQQWLTFAGCLLTVPWFVWVVLIPIYHWKDRYVGEQTNLWGALLVIETSGWSKIIYWFRHVLPDRRKSGRYANAE
jgi:hypothetical protein